MFKFIVLFAAIAVAAAAPGLLAETHTVLHPAVVSKTAIVDNSASSAITHQSFTNLVKKVPVAPVIHTYAAPASLIKTVETSVVHTAPVLHAAPVVHAVPVVHSAQLLHSSPLVHSYAAAPVIHSVSAVHSVPIVGHATYSHHH